MNKEIMAYKDVVLASFFVMAAALCNAALHNHVASDNFVGAIAMAVCILINAHGVFNIIRNTLNKLGK